MEGPIIADIRMLVSGFKSEDEVKALLGMIAMAVNATGHKIEAGQLGIIKRDDSADKEDKTARDKGLHIPKLDFNFNNN